MAVLVVCLSWLCVSVGVLLGFIFLHFGVLPIPIKHLYLFGKLRKKGDVSILSYVDVPKRWFLHFYIIGLVCNTCALVILTDVWREYLPISSDQILQLLHLRKGDVSGEPSPVMPVLLVLVLEELQILRRLYENMSVSVFSESKMSMIHYFTGVLLYATFSISLLAELVARQKIPSGVNWAISLPEWSGIGLFLWAWYKQFKLTGLLAKLRKTAKGAVANLSHHKPRGDLFEWVSCPHFLMEILIYLSFCLITRFQSPTVLSVTCFVIVNQTISAVMTHKWYRASLRQYPAHRKAIVPYLL